MTWPLAFALTLAIEVPVYVAALSLVGSVRPWRAVVLGVAVNVVSHPLLWFVLVPALRDLGEPTAILIAELAVLVGEAAALFVSLRQDRWVALPAAVVANGMSFLAGVLLQT